MTAEQKTFIEKVGKAAAVLSGVLPSLVVAQAILESNWGKSGLTKNANALFGIKAGTGWKGRVYSANTKECYDGVKFTDVTALFRAYDSWDDSIKDHNALLTGAARYKDVIGELCYKKACAAIKAAGYATDPDYAGKLIGLIEKYRLFDYDTVSAAGLGTVKVYLNGVFYRADTVNENGTNFITLPGLPVRITLRDALELAGYCVTWDAAASAVICTKEVV